MNDFLTRIKFVKWTDFLACFLMLPALVISPFYRLKRRHLWLIMERANEARDNGYWFFKYLRESQPNVDAVYVISPDSVDYNKVAVLGKTIKPGTLLHWIYYFAAKYNISSQKDGNPNAAVCFVLENYLRINNHRVFLQHGVIKDDLKWLYYKISNFIMFSCTAKRERNFVEQQFGYPKGIVVQVGLTRHDNLLAPHEIKRQIIVMPTWREWLGRTSTDTDKYEVSRKFTDSEYYKVWNSLLNSEHLLKILTRTEYKLLFFPHSNLQKFISEFTIPQTDRIMLADATHYDVQQLLMESAALVTDYSSIFFDFAYQDKPLAYYQFDYEKFRAGQYQEGYFSYQDDGFGPIVKQQDELLSWIEITLNNGCSNSSVYSQRINQFFTFRDNDNCKRTYNAICDLKI